MPKELQSAACFPELPVDTTYNHLLSGGIDFHWRTISRKSKACAPEHLVDLATGSGDVAFKLRDKLGQSSDPGSGLL